jgi:hypothetical protein
MIGRGVVNGRPSSGPAVRRGKQTTWAEPAETQAEEQPHDGTHDKTGPRVTLTGVQAGERAQQREGKDEEDHTKDEAQGLPHGGSVIGGRCNRK